MANRLFPTARSAFLRGEIDMTDAGVTAIAVSSAYTFNEAHEFVDDLAGVLDAVAMTSNTVLTDGIFDAADVTFNVATGQVIAAIIIALDTGVDATSPLIYFADENDDGTLISRASDGTPISVLWSASTERIFKI